MWVWVDPYLKENGLILGNAAKVIAIPIMLTRILWHGPAGVSLATQVLHALIFAMEDFSFLYHRLSHHGLSAFNVDEVFKPFFYTFGSAMVAMTLAWKKYNEGSRSINPFTSKSCSSACLEVVSMVVLSVWLGFGINHSHYPSVSQTLWDASKFLSMFAEVPQLVVTYKARRGDIGVYVYLGTLAAYRTFYMPIYVQELSYYNLPSLPISLFTAAVHLCVLLVGAVLLVIQRYQPEDTVLVSDHLDVKYVSSAGDDTSSGSDANKYEKKEHDLGAV